MATTPGDPEYEALVAIGEELKTEYVADESWDESPFGWIKKRPSRQRGKIAEQLVDGWLKHKRFSVRRSPDSDADRIVDGSRTEIKSSTIWAAGSYKFQQIRDQDYRVLICLGLSPFEVHAWAFPKALLMELWREGAISSQHGGAGGQDTAWLQIRPGPPADPEWVQEWGGGLDEMYSALKRLL